MTGESMGIAAENLRKRLREHAPRFKSRRQMAEEIGVAKETLTRWLRKEDPVTPNPRLDELEQYAEALGLPVAALLGDPAQNGTDVISPGDVELVMAKVAEQMRPKLRADLRAGLAAELRRLLDEWVKRE